MKIGVLGGGQLARMLALAGYPLGIDVIGYESVSHTCATQVTRVIQGDYTDESALAKFAQSVDCVTFETENLPLSCAQLVARHGKVMPSVDALKITQDRLFEKELLNNLGIATAKFFKVDSWEDLKNALEALGFPGILKTRRSGYDGKGQALIRDWDNAKQAWEQLQGNELIFEAFVKFDYEVSMISVRSVSGEIKFYPLIENQHKDGILRVSKAPLLNELLQNTAEDYALRLIQHFSYVGVMTIEFFVVDGSLIANEIAPRVHNSGHWTIEGAVTSQFENHLRALCDLPLGETKAVGWSAMCNLIGTEPNMADVLRVAGAHYHSYGKEPRQGRKLGHVTLNEENPQLLEVQLNKLMNLL